MGIVHQCAKPLHIILLKRLHCLQCAAVFVNRVARTSALDLILDDSGIFIELCIRQLAERFDRLDLLQSFQRRLALHAPLVVRRRNEAVRLVRVCDDDAAALEVELAVAVLKCIAVEQDRAVLLAHADGKLIHDAAVHANEFILRLLRELYNLHHVDAESKLIVQNDPHQDLDGSGRRKPRAVGQRPIDEDVETVRCRMSCILHHAHDADGIVGPAIGRALHRTVHGELHHALLLCIHRVEARHIIRTRRSERIRAERDRTRKDVPAVVVRMLADEIHTSRREIRMRFSRTEFLTKYFFHLIQDCHWLLLHVSSFVRLYFSSYESTRFLVPLPILSSFAKKRKRFCEIFIGKR